MRDEHDQTFQPAAPGAGAGNRWGDPVTLERAAELRALADRQRRWATGAETDTGTVSGPPPMAGVRLNGADVFWLAAYALAGPDGNIEEAQARLRPAASDPDVLRSLDLSALHLEGADLSGADLSGADLSSSAALGAFALYELGKHIDAGTSADVADVADEPMAGAGHTLHEPDEEQEVVRGMPAAPPPPPPPAPAPRPAPAPEPVAVPPLAPPAYGQPPASVPDASAAPMPWQSAAPPGTFPGAVDGEPAPASERVTFTSHYPREVTPKVWERLLVFIALDTPQAAAQVEAMAAERLRQRRDEFRAATAPSSSGLRRGTRLTIVPNLPGLRSDPAMLTVEWVDDAQCYEFRVRADDARPGLAVNGLIEILEGPILRGEIPLAIFVRGERQPTPDAGHDAVAHAAAYRNTFPSYSRRDESLVKAFETVAEAGGDRFLRDVRTLRAGEQWDPALLTLIDRADVFQLFWSARAATSPQVEREWRYALAHSGNRANFIRPVFWTTTPYRVPPELQHFNFARLDPSALAMTHSWWSGIFRRR